MTQPTGHARRRPKQIVYNVTKVIQPNIHKLKEETEKTEETKETTNKKNESDAITTERSSEEKSNEADKKSGNQGTDSDYEDQTALMKKLIEQHEKMKEAGDDEDDIDKDKQKDSNEGSNEGSESSETKEIAYTTMRKIQEIQRDAEGAESKRNEEEIRN